MLSRQDQRSLRNLHLTKKFHFPYMGGPIFFALLLLAFNHLLTLVHFYRHAESVEQFQLLAVEVTIAIAISGLCIIGNGVLAAHRIAGVHIRLKKVFDQVREGELETRLRFRSHDKLEDVEESFNTMMDSLQQRVRVGAKRGGHQDSLATSGSPSSDAP